MDYVALVNAFIKETGITDQVQTLANAEDDVVQAAHWINEGWKMFQTERRWPFRWTEGSLTVNNGTTTYVPDDLTLTTDIDIDEDSFWASEGTILTETYKELRDRRRATASVDTTRVLYVAVRNHHTIETYPDIAGSQTVHFDYWAGATELSADDDVPNIPADFHMLIVHAALFRYGADAGGQDGANQFASHGGLYAKLKNDYANRVL